LGYRHTSYAPLPLALLVVLVISFANLPLMGYAGSSDLTVDGIWLEDASQPGQPISQVSPLQSFLIVATIKNIGQEAASGYYVDVYYDSDYGRGGPDNIAAGEVQVWYVGPLTAQDGTHTTKWIVDPDNQIAELDENNNQREYVFTVGSETVTTTVTSSSTSSTTELTSTSTSSTAESTSTLTSSTTQPTSTSTSSTEFIGSTTTTTTTPTFTSTSQTAPRTLTLTPVSGLAGTVISVSGSNYQGASCVLTAVPSSLFTSQACSIVAGTLTGSFAVDSNAAAGDYSVTVQTNGDPSDSAASVFTVTANLASTATTVTLTMESTLYSYLTTTTTVTSYTGTQTSTSTIVVPTTVTVDPSTSTSTVQTTQVLPWTGTTTVTGYTTTTVTSYTGTQTSTSTIVVPTAVTISPSSTPLTVQTTQVLTPIGTTTVTGHTTTTATSYTGTQTSTSTIVVPTTVTIGASTAILTVQRTQSLVSTGTTTATGYTTKTVTGYTSTQTSTSTRIVYTTVTESGAGAGAPSSLAYLGFLSLLAVTAGGRITAGEGWRIPRSRSRMERRCSITSQITGWSRISTDTSTHRMGIDRKITSTPSPARNP